MVSKEVTLKLMDSAEILIRSFKADDLRRIYIYDGLQTIIDALPRCQTSCRLKNLTLRCGGDNGHTIFRSIYRAGVI